MAMNDVECCDFYQVHEDVVKAVNDKMPDEDKLYDLAEIFKVFGDSTRIKILYVLFEAEMCVCDIAQLLNMNQSCEDHHQPGYGAYRGIGFAADADGAGMENGS